MIFLPALMPVAQAAGVSTMTMFIPTVLLTWRYRKALHIKPIIVPFLIYSIVATLAVPLGKQLDTVLLKRMLGGLLIAISLYFSLRKTKHQRPYPWPVNGCFMVISGFFNGLFGIGGPLMALYFLMRSRSKEEYLASIQFFFFMDGIYVSSLRFGQHILSLPDLGFAGMGLIGALIGTAAASRIVTHLNTQRVSQIVYAFIGVSGLYYCLFA